MPLLVMRSYAGTLLDQSCRMAVRRQIDYGRAAGRAVGHLGVRLQHRGPPRQLSVQGLRRAGPGAEAGPGRRARGGALRDRAGRAWWTRPGRAELPAARARRRSRARSASTRPSTTPIARRWTAIRQRPGRRRPRGRRRAGLPGPPPGHDPRRPGQRRAAATSMVRALPRRPAGAGHRAAAAGARAAPRAHLRSRGPAEETRAAAAATPAAVAAVPVAAHPLSRTRSSCRTARYTAVVTNAGGGASVWRGRAVTR